MTSDSLDESENDGHYGGVWSDKAYHTRIVLLGGHERSPSAGQLPSAPVPLDGGLMFSGGGATEATQSTEWFEVSLVTSSTTCVIVQATINTVQICPATIGTQLFHEVSILGTERNYFPGRPRLPTIPLIIAVNHERQVNLTIETTGATVENEVRVMPAQHSDDIALTCGRPFCIDEELYASDADYPGAAVIMSQPVIHRNIRCVHLNLVPVQYNPTDSTLTMYSSVRAIITYGTISTINTLNSAPQCVDSMLEGYLEASIANYHSLNLQSRAPGGERMLAIIAEEYWDNEALHDLLDWHDFEGIKTKRMKAWRQFTVTTESTIATDRDLRHKQRDWIRNTISAQYAETDPSTGLRSLLFVLLVGDVDVMPDGDIIEQGPNSNGHVVADAKFLSWFDWDDYRNPITLKTGAAGYDGFYLFHNSNLWCWYQGDQSYGFQLTGNPGLDIMVSRITGQAGHDDEVAAVCRHSLGYATYQNDEDTTGREGWPSTSYASDPAPLGDAYHWSSKANVQGFKYDPIYDPVIMSAEEKKVSWPWRFVRLSYRLWDMIDGLPGSPADVTLINGQFETDGSNVCVGNQALINGRQSEDEYDYWFWAPNLNPEDEYERHYMNRRVNGWNDGLGTLLFVTHGQLCMFPCWDRVDSPNKNDCLYCLESYYHKCGSSLHCPCGTGTTMAVNCSFLCGEDLNVASVATLENEYKTPVVFAFSCLTNALKQIGSATASDVNGLITDWSPSWGMHWRKIGAWNYPENEAECDCSEHYICDECYEPNDESAYLSEAAVHGIPIGERAVAQYEPLTNSGGGALAWYSTAGVHATNISCLLYSRIVEGIWPGETQKDWQIRLGAITWHALAGISANYGPGSDFFQDDLFHRITRQMMWIGDSALDIRTKYPLYLHLDPVPTKEYVRPEDLDGEEPIRITMGENAEYDKDEYEEAPYALLTFSQGSWDNGNKNWLWKQYWVGIADENGLVEVPALDQVEPGLIRIVATRHNCRPALFWIDLVE